MSSGLKLKRYPPTREDREDFVPLPLLRVLLLDDDGPVRQSLADDLKEAGCVVDDAERTDEATRLLQEHAYQVVFVDINLLPFDIPGDLFIFKHRGLMLGATVVAITAQDILQKIGYERQNDLNKLGVMILTKGTPSFSDEMEGIVADKMRAIRVEMLALRDHLYGITKEHPAPPSDEQLLLDSLREFLVDWLRTRKVSDKRAIYYGGKMLSMNEIAGEIDNNTEIGRDHVQMLVSLFKRVMGVQK